MKHELIKQWNYKGFSVRLYNTGGYDYYKEKHKLAYRFADNQAGVIFEGDDFYPSPLHAIDSILCVRALLSFMTLQPGDTDSEYFDNYTPEQLDWCKSARCEELQLYLYGFKL